MKDSIFPCIWFNPEQHSGQQAALKYKKAFGDVKTVSDNGMVMMVEILGEQLMFLNGGPMFTPNPSISFFVVLASKEAVDQAWKVLGENGKVLMPLDTYDWSEYYGWIQDAMGVSWQLSYGKLEEVGQTLSPTLMFTGKMAGKAREALTLYTNIFQPSEIVGILPYGPGDEDKEGLVKHAMIRLNSYVLMFMDSTHEHDFGFDEGMSLVVPCENQNEIDTYWEVLTANGGQESQCGWLKDPYGVSWQIVPKVLFEMMNNPDPKKRQGVIDAFMPMKKFDIATLEQAYADK
jgi:predicted 3-demethylubiquinone-9 3-methyltransferase (glyoxalase superfamily)